MIVLTITLLMISVAFNILQKLREEQYKQEVKKLQNRISLEKQKIKTKPNKQVDTQQEKDIRHIMKYINVDYEKAREIYHTNNKTP